MRGLKIGKQSKTPEKKLTKQEQNIKDATEMKKMRPVFTSRDTPLSPTPSPKSSKDKEKKKSSNGLKY
jgi:hypothetical protein